MSLGRQDQMAGVRTTWCLGQTCCVERAGKELRMHDPRGLPAQTRHDIEAKTLGENL